MSKPSVLLIHGFLEDHSMWNPLIRFLGNSYDFIAPDLPGHGTNKSEVDTMERMAEEIAMVVNARGAGPFFVVGHSMGGYVACALAHKYPTLFSGLCMFHSTASADSNEKKQNRVRAMNLVRENKELYIRQLIVSLYAPEQRDHFRDAIEEQIASAGMMSVSAITGCLNAMMNRPDHVETLQQRSFPLFYFLGDQDPRLPLDEMKNEIDKLPGAVIHCAQRTGHMGHIECPAEVESFIQRILRAQ